MASLAKGPNGTWYSVSADIKRILVFASGGSVSAEHGIGRIKKSFLPIQYGHEKVAQMKAVKDALDPCGLLNPGVLF